MQVSRQTSNKRERETERETERERERERQRETERERKREREKICTKIKVIGKVCNLNFYYGFKCYHPRLTQMLVNYTTTLTSSIDYKYFLFLESPRSIPVLSKCDVLVVGGGPSGIAASLGARRAGCDVILVRPEL